MTDDIHALIQRFLQQCTVVPLSTAREGEPVKKAGLVPYIIQEGVFRYYVMKPHAKHPGLPPPPFQLCKGTRMYRAASGVWEDMGGDESCDGAAKESLVATALREGVEELGLKLSNIAALADVGPYAFTSASTGNDKCMWLFAARLERPEDVMATADIAATTAERTWLSATEFAVVGRPDHRYILADIEAKLPRY